jgi:glycogen synthase
MLVANGVDGDSRVQKIAWSAAAAGWDVTLIGRAPADEAQRYRLGAADVVLVPVPKVVSDYEKARIHRSALTRSGRDTYREARAALALRDAAAARTARRRALAGGTAAARAWLAHNPQADRVIAPLGRGPLGGTVRKALASAAGLADPNGGWRSFNPWFADLETAMAPVVKELNPDLIHAHDFHMVGLGARLAATLGTPDHPIHWLYDAHEYLAGIEVPTAGDVRARLRRRMLIGVEREYIGAADAVVTVSEGIATRLQEDHRLNDRPLVILNAPVIAEPTAATKAATAAAAAETDAPTRQLRNEIGLTEDVPLLLYSGGMSPRRGISTVIDALPKLPEAHLALIARDDDPDIPALRRRAEDRKVADRVHVRPYVPVDQITAYIASATIGLIPIVHRPNHELSLITKYFEYLHARLPIVTSDVREMAAETKRLGVGEVFTAEDPASLAQAVRKVLADLARYRAVYDAPDDPRTSSSWAAQAAKLSDLYQRLIGRPPGPAVAPGPLRLVSVEVGAEAKAEEAK